MKKPRILGLIVARKNSKGLKNKHPSLYFQFLKGDFVVKINTGSFNCVAGDMKSE